MINLIFYKIPYITLTDMFGLVFSEKSRRRTKTIMNSNEPTWNQTFMYYGVTSEDLQNLLLEITVWDYDRMGPNEFMGEVSYMHVLNTIVSCSFYSVLSALFKKKTLCSNCIQFVFFQQVLLDLHSANLEDDPFWYPLSQHDENSIPLPQSSPRSVSLSGCELYHTGEIGSLIQKY